MKIALKAIRPFVIKGLVYVIKSNVSVLSVGRNIITFAI